MSPEQSAYRIGGYDLAIEVDPERRMIQASATITVKLLEPLRHLVLDLDSPLSVQAVELQSAPVKLPFERRETQIWVELPEGLTAGSEIGVRIDYSGHPREAARPPWRGGFIWSKTKSGQPWIAVACQVDGADLWLPILDHPLGEPRRADLRITVPEPLTVAANGTLQSVSQPRAGFRTFHWHSANPINPYNLTLNIAPYETITDTYTSVTGEPIPLIFWVLPENLEQGHALFRQFPRQLAFLEEKLGPYPFRNEKYGVAEVPYLGMEHQTVIGYGNGYRDGELGFDWLHFHELAHEWWGNMVTARDWSDFWLHEGFASYMEALYAEELGGRGALKAYLRRFRSRLRNREPLAPWAPQSSVEKYFAAPDFRRSDGDVNFKAAWVLHSLRFLIGDEAFFQVLRRFAYPLPELETVTDGSQCRFVVTEDFRRTAESVAGRDLSWFFHVYVRQPQLPKLEVERSKGRLHLRWKTPEGLPFLMPVEILIDGERRIVPVDTQGTSIEVGAENEVSLDPDNWVLREETELSS